jgi:hypothetical protein
MESNIKTTVKRNEAGATRRSPEFAEIYSNGFACRYNVQDLGLVFMRNVFDVEGGMAPEEQVAVTMSPQQFKQFVVTAQAFLNLYESQFGKLPDVNSPNLSGVL